MYGAVVQLPVAIQIIREIIFNSNWWPHPEGPGRLQTLELVTCKAVPPACVGSLTSKVERLARVRSFYLKGPATTNFRW
ncbi:hypothetical protein SLA2020_080670 [Shorea laevis]